MCQITLILLFLIVLPTDGPHQLAYISKDLTEKMHSLTSAITPKILSKSDHYWTIFGPSAVTETFLRHISDFVCNLFNLTQYISFSLTSRNNNTAR
jgi:hypothetical protein